MNEDIKTFFSTNHTFLFKAFSGLDLKVKPFAISKNFSVTTEPVSYLQSLYFGQKLRIYLLSPDFAGLCLYKRYKTLRAFGPGNNSQSAQDAADVYSPAKRGGMW